MNFTAVFFLFPLFCSNVAQVTQSNFLGNNFFKRCLYFLYVLDNYSLLLSSLLADMDDIFCLLLLSPLSQQR